MSRLRLSAFLAVVVVILGTFDLSAASLALWRDPRKLPLTVDVSAEGSLDWVHWGTNTNGIQDRKVGTVLISNYTLVGGAGGVAFYQNNGATSTGYHWTNGTNSAANTVFGGIV